MKKKLKKTIHNDLYRYEGKKINKLSYYKNIIINRGFRYTVLKRKASYYKENNIFIFCIYRILMRLYSSKTGFQIPYNVKIGDGLYISHWGRIIINEEAILGKNMSIATGVVIGKEFRGKREGTPIIGDDVYIGANSVIVGSVSIGSNVLIAPNSYVNTNVPNDSIVIGNPSKVICNKPNATYGYLNNRIDIKI